MEVKCAVSDDPHHHHHQHSLSLRRWILLYLKYSRWSHKQGLIYSVQSLRSQQDLSSEVISVYWLIVE